ncbi:putative alpha beta hydrolase fold-1 protein [Lasiodiplodia theobromae]|nr:putative alpha beta hydrolase fold-1 protein [Lasiodiplodia theobromae]
MESYTKKTFTSPRSLTYTYYDSAPTKPIDASKPTIFLVHGFPDNAHLWKHVLPHLEPLGFRIILPDLLGYGSSSRPTTASHYTSRACAADYAALLAAEGITRNVIAIGHDWGSYYAQRLYLWHPELVVGLGMLSAPYMPPDAPFDLAGANAATEAATGWPRLAYWELFTAEDAAKVLDGHLESFWDACHGAGEHWVRGKFCMRGELRRFVEEGREAEEVLEYARPGNGWREEWLSAVREGGGMAGALGPYLAMAGNYQYEVEKELPRERIVVQVPSFFLGCERDDACLWQLIEGPKKAGLLPDLTVKIIDSTHWCTMEKPDVVGKALYDWLSEKF